MLSPRTGKANVPLESVSIQTRTEEKWRKTQETAHPFKKPAKKSTKSPVNSPLHIFFQMVGFSANF